MCDSSNAGSAACAATMGAIGPNSVGLEPVIWEAGIVNEGITLFTEDKFSWQRLVLVPCLLVKMGSSSSLLLMAAIVRFLMSCGSC